MGCISFDTEFGQQTTISGDNATGKTTVEDAYSWCLVGKNAKGETDFYIKNTKDLSMNRQDHVVEQWLDVDGEEVILKKVYKEVHTHIKGSEGTVFTGHKTDYYYNDVPLTTEKEYNAKIDAIIPSNILKSITNINYFNKLGWKEKRAILEQIADIPSDKEIANGNADFETLMNALIGKSFNEYQTQLNKQRQLINDEIKLIPIKINEASLSKKEAILLQDEKMLESIKAKISDVQQQKDDISKTNKVAFEEINKKQKELSDLKTKLNEATQTRKSSANEGAIKLDGEINVLSQKISNLKDQIKYQKEKIDRINKDLLEKESRNAQLREAFTVINSEKPPVVDPEDTKCPTCETKLGDDQLKSKETELLANWNKDKIRKTEALNKEGKENNAAIEEKRTEISVIEADILTKETENVTLQKELDQKNIEKSKLLVSTEDKPSQIELDLNNQIAAFIIPDPPKVDFTVQDEEIKKLQEQNDACVTNIEIIKTNKATDDRIKELKAQEIALSQKLTSFDKTLFVMSEFTKNKVTQIEQAVNKLFKYCQVKMFEKQVNGEMDPTCLITYDDVPYQNVNNAGKINMGVDIITVFTNFYQIQAPVFIDNTESINKIIDTDLQIIKLQVSNEHKLTVTINN